VRERERAKEQKSKKSKKSKRAKRGKRGKRQDSNESFFNNDIQMEGEGEQPFCLSTCYELSSFGWFQRPSDIIQLLLIKNRSFIT